MALKCKSGVVGWFFKAERIFVRRDFVLVGELVSWLVGWLVGYQRFWIKGLLRKVVFYINKITFLGRPTNLTSRAKIAQKVTVPILHY